MSIGISKEAKWCGRAREICKLATKKLEAYEEAVKLKQQILSEQEKQLEKLKGEKDYEERLDVLWQNSQLQEQIEILMLKIKDAEYRRDHSEEVAKKEYGLGTDSEIEVSEEEFESLFAIDEKEEKRKKEEEETQKLKDEFSRSFETLNERTRKAGLECGKPWLDLPSGPGTFKLVSKAKNLFLGGSYKAACESLTPLAKSVDSLEREARSIARHKQNLESFKTFDKGEALESLGEAEKKITEARSSAFKKDSMIGRTFDNSVVPIFNQFSEYVKVNPAEKVARAKQFFEVKGILTNFIAKFDEVYKKAQRPDQEVMDSNENFSGILRCAREMLWEVTRFECMSDKKSVQKNIKKLEKAKSPAEKMQQEAQAFVEFGTMAPSNPGASASFMVKGMDGELAYIFKPQKGEKTQAGWPDGGGAPREVLFSSLNEFTKGTIGLDFGVCPTTSVSLKHEDFADMGSRKGTVGAIQETAKCTGDLASLCGRGGMERERNPNFKEDLVRINTEDVQKIALLDFMTLNLDRQFDNVLVNDTGDDVRLIPIDAGNALPPRGVFDKMTSGDEEFPFGNPMSATPMNPEVGLTDGQNALAQLPQSQEPFSKDMLQKIAALKPDDVVEQMKKSEEALPKEMRGKVEPASYEMVRRSILFLKEAAKSLTVFEISDAYASPKDGFKLVLEAEEGKLAEVIQQVISKTKERASALVLEHKKSLENEKFFRENFDALRKLGWLPKEIYANPESMLDILGQETRKSDVEKGYLIAGGDDAYSNLGEDRNDFLFDKYSALLRAANKRLKEHPEEYEELSSTLGWKRQEVLDNRQWCNEILKKRYKREDILKEYQEWGGDEVYKAISSQEPKTVFLLDRWVELKKVQQAKETLHWDLEVLTAHPAQIETILAKSWDGAEYDRRYKELGGDKWLAAMTKDFSPTEFLVSKVTKLEGLCNNIRNNGWGEPSDLAPAIPKWGMTMASSHVHDTLREYLKLGGDDAFHQHSEKSASDVFILERLQLVEDAAFEYSRREYLEDLNRANAIAREADDLVQEMLKNVLRIDGRARELCKSAVTSSAEEKEEEVKQILLQIRISKSQVQSIQKMAAVQEGSYRQRFLLAIPPKEQAGPLNLQKSRSDTILVMDKVTTDLPRFESILASISISEEVAEGTLNGTTNQIDAFEKIVVADAKRVTRFNYPAIGGADARLAGDLKAMGSQLESLEKESDEATQQRIAGAILTKLSSLNDEVPRLIELMDNFEEMISELLEGYPEFVVSTDTRFEKALGDFESCGELLGEFRENISKYKEKIKLFTEKATSML